jgi:Divergent InlB B-repeat domain
MRLVAISKPVLLVTVILVAGATAIVVDGHSSPTSGAGSGNVGMRTALLTPSTSWDGVNYSASCSGCLPPDAQVASGTGYVFEMVNASYDIFNTAGATLASGTLATLFGTAHDSLADPQVRFDPTALRWFASVDDLSKRQIYYGASETSDPTAAWNIQHFNIAGPNSMLQSTLGVDALNLVVATNLYGPTGTFVGAQVWVANKSQLMGTGGVMTWSSTVLPTEEALVPAEALTAFNTMYLVGDGVGGTTSFDLLTLTGSPPGAPTLSAPMIFTTNTTGPPNATQAGSAKLVSVGDGRVESAVWRSGTLWAAATDGCTPSGDTALRSCLHLWKLNTGTSTMSQDFDWSTGAGTYDFDPALSTNPAGAVTVVFGESSATLDPSVLVTGQTAADGPGTLEPAVLLKAGAGPDAAGSYCTATVCPFGAYFGAAFEPASGNHFWVVGEYTGSDSTTNYWRTWVASVDAVATYSVNFSESGLAPGTSWSVTLNGNTTSSSGPSIVDLEPVGTYSFSVSTPIPGGSGTRYVANPAVGSFAVTKENVTEAINFTTQYQLTTSLQPMGAGTVNPTSGWFNATSSVSLGALANSTYAFHFWAGNGSGSYNGTSNPARVVMDGPVSEQATFVNSTTYRVTFASSGLPPGTSWNVTLNGLEETSRAANATFNVTNGSYTYVVGTPIAGLPGVEYSESPAGGSVSVMGANVTVRAPFTTEYRLTTSVVTAGSGSVSPPAGWLAAGAVVSVSALPATGYFFASWSGSGPGNYSGANDPATVTMDGPVSETASFQPIPHPTYRITFGVSPLGSGAIAFNGQNYSDGQSIVLPPGTYSLSPGPSRGWEFGHWAVSGGVTLGLGNVNVTGAGWINATFSALHLVSIVTAPTTCGSVSLAGNIYANGASVALANGTYAVTATACGNYSAVSILGTGGVQVSGDRMNVTANGSVVATFSPPGSTGTSTTGIDAPIPLWALLLAIGLAVAALAILLAPRRRRGKPAQESVPPGAAGAASVSGKGGPTAPVKQPTPVPSPNQPPEWKED